MDGTIKVRVENGVYEFVGDCFFGVAPPFFRQWVSNAPLCRSVNWDLQADDHERPCSLCLKGVTSFTFFNFFTHFILTLRGREDTMWT